MLLTYMRHPCKVAVCVQCIQNGRDRSGQLYGPSGPWDAIFWPLALGNQKFHGLTHLYKMVCVYCIEYITRLGMFHIYLVPGYNSHWLFIIKNRFDRYKSTIYTCRYSKLILSLKTAKDSLLPVSAYYCLLPKFLL